MDGSFKTPTGDLSGDSPSAKNLDDHEDDGSKEDTELLPRNGGKEHNYEHRTQGRTSKNAGNSHDRRHGNRSMVHSLYTSPKETVVQRRQASLPGSPTDSRHQSGGIFPMFISNMSQLWSDGDEDVDDGKGVSRIRPQPSSRMTIEDASPPLPWKEASHSFASREDLSTGHRFSMDDISDGAFAVPSGLSDSQQPAPLAEERGLSRLNDISKHADIRENAGSSGDQKKRRWGPKSQKASVESTLINETVQDHTHQSQQSQQSLTESSIIEIQRSVASAHNSISESLLFNSPAILSTETPSSPRRQTSTTKQDDTGRITSSTFGLKSLSSPGMGFVSGLASLKNSIMIPALSSSSKSDRVATGPQSSSLALLQSSLLDFKEQKEESGHQSQLHWQPPVSSSSSPAAEIQPLLLRSEFLKSGSDLMLPSLSSATRRDNQKRGEKLKQRVDRSSDTSRSGSPSVNRPIFGLVFSQGKSAAPFNGRRSSFSRHRVASQNSAVYSLSTLETEFQQLIQRQIQLSAHKSELSKELLSLYSRRNINEVKQEEAARMEQFVEADSAATTIRLVQERIHKLETIYVETGEALWKCKKRQDELAKSISEMHQTVIHEMEEMRQAREKERIEYQLELESVKEKEMDRVLTERTEVEKENSDIALGQDFLGKNEAELLERMEEETKMEQEEMGELVEKQKSTQAEIQDLTRQLEQLRLQDRELTRSISTLQQKIGSITQQFDGRAKEVLREKRELERRLSHVQQRSQHLDRQESGLQKAVQDAVIRQQEMQSEIQNIISQRDQLEEVQRLFQSELAAIRKLRLEEEAFREKEAGWNMRASALAEGMKRHEAQIEALTNQASADQKQLASVRLDLEATQKLMSTIESLKSLSVRRRDFKQASHCSAELTKCREMMALQQQELERLEVRVNGPDAQEQLEALRKECDSAGVSAREDERALFIEIQKETSDILARLRIISTGTNAELPLDGEKPTEDQARASDAILASKTSSFSDGQLSHLLMTELWREIESVQAVSQIRFGRKATVHVGLDSHARVDLKDAGDIDSTTMISLVDVAEKRNTLEKEIQTAVAEEDYDTAAELQAQLDAVANIPNNGSRTDNVQELCS
ncbi:hypothetical protein EDD11_003913 [Mortierella claussenii]|nr:hypothetical protein EDD11_003913 [Mortierella claussenii]